MFDQKQKIAAVFLGAAVIHDLVVSLRNKKKFNSLLERHVEDVTDYNQLVDEFNALKREFESSQTRSIYLASMLEDHGIDFDEFDLIALTNPM